MVIGHNFIFLANHQNLSRGIYLFHMPLFFFLSGLVFAVPNCPEWAYRRAETLLKPYIAVGVAYALWIACRDHRAPRSEILGLLYGTGDTLSILRPMWFLPHLFIATLATAIFFIGIRKSGVKGPTVPILLSISLLFLAPILINPYAFDLKDSLLQTAVGGSDLNRGLPWSIDLLPLSVGYVSLGYSLIHMNWFSKKSSPLLTASVIALFLALVTSSDASLNMDNRSIIGGPIAIALSLLGIYAVWLISKHISSLNNSISRALSKIGSISLFILIFHVPPQAIVSVTSNKLQLSNSISILLGVIAGLTIPLLISSLTERSQLLAFILMPSKSISSLRNRPGFRGTQATRSKR